jgi:hypothetical protein
MKPIQVFEPVAPIRKPRTQCGVICDCLGIAASCGCALHCAAMPILIGWLSGLGLSWLGEETTHHWMFAVCVLMALAAFLPGYWRHRRPTAALLGITGIAILAWTVFAVSNDCCDSRACCNVAADDCKMTDSIAADNECYGRGGSTPWFMSLGGMFLVAGHLTNRNCCRAPAVKNSTIVD